MLGRSNVEIHQTIGSTNSRARDLAKNGAAEGVFGEIVEETVEISNIELTSEFTDLIIVQRGFQASSQVITVANEMLQQLLDMGRGR